MVGRVWMGMLAVAAMACLGTATPARAAFNDRPGDFDYYSLVLSWSPTFCQSDGGSHSDDPQCSSRRPYAFVLHGLWPQFDKGWPESCDIGKRPFVPRQLINAMLDIMPSDKLVIHEYAKHGTCSGLDPTAYFGLARQLYSSIAIPQRYNGTSSETTVAIRDVVSDFRKANPALRPDMIAVSCNRDGRLREITFCFSKSGQPAHCGRNEDPARMCRASSVSLPPVRGGGASPRSWVPQRWFDLLSPHPGR